MKITFYNLTWLDDLGYFTSDLTDQQVIAVYVMAGLVVLTVVSLIVTIIIRSRRRKEEQNLQNKIEENDDNVLPLSETMVEEEKISTFEERIEKFVQPVEEYVEEKEKKEVISPVFQEEPLLNTFIEKNENIQLQETPLEIKEEEVEPIKFQEESTPFANDVEEVFEPVVDDVKPLFVEAVAEEKVELEPMSIKEDEKESIYNVSAVDEEIEIDENFVELDLPRPTRDENKKPLFQPILNIEPETEVVLEEKEDTVIKVDVEDMFVPHTTDEFKVVKESVEDVGEIQEPTFNDIDQAINDLHDGKVDEVDQLNVVAESLNEISKQLEHDYTKRPPHTDFMKKQEETSIISYQQLVEKTNVHEDDSFRREFVSQEQPEDEAEDLSLDINEFIKKSEENGISSTNNLKVDESLKDQIEQIHRLNPEQKRRIEEETERYMKEVNRISDNLKDLNDSFDVQLMLKIEQFRRENKKNNEFLHILKNFKDKL
jgi:hypothetical protein